MPTKHKVLVIGLDGATWRLLDPWIRRGKLPWFADAKKTWFYGTLHSTLPPLTGSAWVSFQTGVNPGKHGIFDFVHYQKNGRNELISSMNVTLPTIWEWLEQGGKRSVVINMPVTFPINRVKSAVVSSLLTPRGERFASPRSVYRKLKAMGYRVDLDEMTFGQPEESMRHRGRLFKEALKLTAKRAEAAHLLMKMEWDFFFVLFKATDIVQHLYFDEPETLELYRRLEKQLKRLITAAQRKYPGKLTTVICSDHGFDRGQTVSFSLYRWLEKEGYLTRKDTKLYGLLRLSYRSITKLSKGLAKSAAVEKRRQRLYDRETLSRVALMRRQAPAWPVPFGIYANDKRVIQPIKTKLEGLRYKGKRVFKKILHKRQVYSGDKLEAAPDLVFLPQPWVRVEANESQKRLWEPKPGHLKGNHYSDPDGIILIDPGPGFTVRKKGSYTIVDLFPTIASILGQPLPVYCDGEALVRPRRGREKEAGQQRAVTGKIESELRKLNDMP